MVAIENHAPLKPPAIPNIPAFIEAGGLLTLTGCDNAPSLMNILKAKENIDALPFIAFTGLLLRDMSFTPAWAVALNHLTTRDYVVSLLWHFSNEFRFTAKLIKSVSEMTGMQRHACIENLLSLRQAHPDKAVFLEDLSAVLHASNRAAHTHARLTTWETAKPEMQSLDTYFQSVFADASKKRLIKVATDDLGIALQLGLLAYCWRTSRPAFYVNNPEDLICATDSIKREGDRGVMQRGPGGPLYDFIQANQQTACALIINYCAFSKNDIERFMSVLKGVVDGVPLPARVLVVAIDNMHLTDRQHLYLESFFDQVEKLPYSHQQLEQYVGPLPLVSEVSEEDMQLVKLYHDREWKERLMGNWMIKGQHLLKQKGALKDAFKKPVLGLHHAPWDQAFRLFWGGRFFTWLY